MHKTRAMRHMLGAQASYVALASFVLLSSCKPKDGTSTVADAAAGPTNAASSGKRAAVPADVCKLVSAADVGAVLGEKVEAKDVPGGGCQFAGGTRKSLYPTLSVAEDFAGAGGIEGAKAGAQATVGGVATPLTVSGASGYVVTGKVATSVSTQAAVAWKGLLVTVTLSGGEKASNEKIAAEIVKLTLAKL